MDYKKLIGPKIPDIVVENESPGVSNQRQGTTGALEIWNDLPEEMKADPSMDSIRREYEQRSRASSTGSTTDEKEYKGKGNVFGSSESAKLLQDKNVTEKSRLLGSDSKGSYLSIGCLSPSPSTQGARKRKRSEQASTSAAADYDEDVTANIVKEGKSKKYLRYVRMVLLFLLWLLFTIILMTKREKVMNMHQTLIPREKTISYWILDAPSSPVMSVSLAGSLLPSAYGNLSRHCITAWVEKTNIPWVPNRGAALLANASFITSTTPSKNSSLIVDSDPDATAAVVAATLLGPTIDINASIVRDKDDKYSNFQDYDERIEIENHSHLMYAKAISDVWTVPLVSEALVDFVPEVQQQNVFHLTDYEVSPSLGLLRLRLKTNLKGSFPVSIGYDPSPINMDDGIVYAAIVLLGLYVLIIFDVVHRTLAAILASTMSIAILAALNERPTMAELISWIDIETLLLLFSMMIIVAVLAETGIFDYLAVFAYKITAGKVWPLINTLCIFTAILSAFLDNVTTTLLMTPVTIRGYSRNDERPIKEIGEKLKLVESEAFGVCCDILSIFRRRFDNVAGIETSPENGQDIAAGTESLALYIKSLPNPTLCEEMKLNPVPILLAMLIYSNIGGAATVVGDPPNVIIASNKDVIDAGIDFSKFALHMSIGVILVMIVVNLQLRFMFRNIKDLKYNDEPQDVQELRHEIAICQRAAASLSSYSKDEEVLRDSLLKKAKRLLTELKLRHTTCSLTEENYKANLEELQEKYPIRDWVLLTKSGIVLVFVISTFFVHSLPGLQLSLGWTALLGAILLLIVADQEDLEGVLARVEWGTLLFFAALFILMEALSCLGLIEWIGAQTEWIIHSVDAEHRLAVAILLILWVSAMASAFVDNIPLTTVMIRIVTSLAGNRELNLPLQPLIWALAFGACLGGNGTLIGASANVVCAGVAEQHGYRFTFVQFFKIGFPVTISSVLVATLYLMVCHVALDWNT